MAFPDRLTGWHGFFSLTIGPFCFLPLDLGKLGGRIHKLARACTGRCLPPAALSSTHLAVSFDRMEVDPHGDLVHPSPKCRKLLKALEGKTVDVTSTGTRDHAALLKVLTCESKARKVCGAELAAYTPCHSSVMSTGRYNGTPHCGHQLAALFACVKAHQSE